MGNKMARNLFPNHQIFRKGIFHSQIGTREKTVLNVQLWNKLFHLQMGTRTKTVLNLVLNDQFGNKVFHSQMQIRNKTVLIINLGTT